MSRSLEFTISSPARIEQILTAFTARDYWLSRLDAFPALDQLDSLETQPDGSVRAVLSRALRHDGHTSPIARFFPREWRVVHTEQWRPTNSGAHGELSVLTYGAPGAATGTALVSPTGTGSHIRCAACVEFGVPLIGGQVENLMGRVLIQNISSLQGFTAEWIRTHC